MNDDNDVSWERRDNSPSGSMDRDKDEEILDLELKINAKKAGTTKGWGLYLSEYDENGNEIDSGDEIHVAEGVFSADRRIEQSNGFTGADDEHIQNFTPDSPNDGYRGTDWLRYLIVGTDIDVDSDNSGEISDTNIWRGQDYFENHPASEIPSQYDKYKWGMIVFVNDDSDDGDADPDNGWNGTDWSGPEANIVVTDEDDLKPLVLRSLDLDASEQSEIDTLYGGANISLTQAGGDGKNRVFTTGSTPQVLLNNSSKDSADQLPDGTPIWDILKGSKDLNLQVEGLELGDVILEVKLVLGQLGYGPVIHTDRVKISNLKLKKIPLGGSANLSKVIIGKVYVPTKWGGVLKVSGTDVELFYNDGSDLDCDTAIKIFKGELDANRVAQGSPCSYTVPENKHGWYYAKITAASATAISSTFIQDGAASTTPWNGWYWPSLDTANPNLYDQTGSYTPLKDYDTVYGTSERAAEEANYSGGDAWWGHCWGWSLAAIAKTQPAATTKNGVSFNQDEMEGLYSELAEGATMGWAWRVGSPSSEIPAGPPTAATGEAVDGWPDDVHKGFRKYIRQRNKAMNGDLRDATGGDSDEVWNHDVYDYESTMQEAPGGNEKIIEVTTGITSNTDTPAMPPDTGKREDTYVYVLEYKNDGTIDGTSADQNWKSCTGFAPSCLGTVKAHELNWQGSHCGITKANVDGLYP